MEIGKLNCRVAIEHRAAGQDATGKPNGAWSVLDNVWASIRHETGAEFVRADHETSIVKASIRIRRRADVTAAMRVVYAGTVYRIVAVLPDYAHREHTDLVCEVVHG